MRMKRVLGLLTLLAGVAAQAALELYCDFEENAPGGVKGVLPSGVIGSFRGPEGGVKYANAAPQELAKRSRQALQLEGGFVYFRENVLPDFSGNWSVHFYFRPDAKCKAAQTLLYRYGSWALEYQPTRNVLVFAPRGGAKPMAFALPPRGLRVKNWNVFAPSDTASWAMAR